MALLVAAVAADRPGRHAAARLDDARRPRAVRVRALRAAQLLRRPDLVVGARPARAALDDRDGRLRRRGRRSARAPGRRASSRRSTATCAGSAPNGSRPPRRLSRMPTGGEAQVPPVVVDGVSKTFRIPRERVHTLKERVLHPMRRAGSRAPRGAPGRLVLGAAGRVLRDRRPQRLRQEHAAQVPGRHLRDRRRARSTSTAACRRSSSSASASTPTSRRATTSILNALMLGLSPREARARVDRVIEFAELEEFADLKLKNYSSGMHVRLAFSVMIQVDADVLLIDEVLAVGDAAFQQKCYDEFHRLRDGGPDDPARHPRHVGGQPLLRPRAAARARRGRGDRRRPTRSPSSTSR